MTRWAAGRGAGTNRPLAPDAPATTEGVTRTPPLAIVAYTLAIWTAVTATPWPNDRVYRSSPHHLDVGYRMPLLCAGRPGTLCWPMPKFLKYWYCVFGLTCWATWTMPTLLEWAMIPAIVHLSVGWYSASWKGKPSMSIDSGTV